MVFADSTETASGVSIRRSSRFVAVTTTSSRAMRPSSGAAATVCWACVGSVQARLEPANTIHVICLCFLAKVMVSPVRRSYKFRSGVGKANCSHRPIIVDHRHVEVHICYEKPHPARAPIFSDGSRLGPRRAEGGSLAPVDTAFTDSATRARAASSDFLDGLRHSWIGGRPLPSSLHSLPHESPHNGLPLGDTDDAREECIAAAVGG